MACSRLSRVSGSCERTVLRRHASSAGQAAKTRHSSCCGFRLRPSSDQIATHEGLPLERMPSSALLKELFSLGILSRDNLEVTQRAFAVRSALVHGFEATGLDQMTEAVADLPRQLLAELDQHAA